MNKMEPIEHIAAAIEALRQAFLHLQHARDYYTIRALSTVLDSAILHIAQVRDQLLAHYRSVLPPKKKLDRRSGSC